MSFDCRHAETACGAGAKADCRLEIGRSARPYLAESRRCAQRPREERNLQNSPEQSGCRELTELAATIKSVTTFFWGSVVTDLVFSKSFSYSAKSTSTRCGIMPRSKPSPSS